MSYTVNASTSVVLVDSTAIGPGQAAVVYLSSQVPPGRTVTIRDSAGYLSSPQSIIVSTTTGVQFADGTSSIQFTQPFGSVTVSSRGATSWNLLNTFGFPLFNTVANVNTLTASTLVGDALQVGGTLSTNGIQARTLRASSTSQVEGPLFASTLVVGTLPNIQIPYETIPGYSAYVMGNAYTDSNVTILGNLSVASGATFVSSATFQGPVTMQSSLTVAGPTTLQGPFQTLGGGTFSAQSMAIGSTLTVVGPLVANTNATVQSNLTVGTTLTTSNLVTSTATVQTGGYVQFGAPTGPRLQARTDLLPGSTVAAFDAPVYTPYLSTGFVTATSTATVQFLNLTSTLQAPAVQQVLFSSAAIVNPAGSLTISSIAANTLTLSNAFTVGGISVSSVQASSITVATSIVGVSATSYVSVASLTTSSFQANSLSTGILYAGLLTVPAVTVSTLTVGDSIVGGPTFSTLSVPTALITAAGVNASSITATTLTASTVTISSGILTSATPTLTFAVPTTQMGQASVSTLQTSSIQVSTITATRLTMGTAPAYPFGPDFYVSSPATSTNVIITGGPGNYVSPFFLSNVIPTGQNPAVPYSTFVRFQADFHSTPPPPGTLIEYTATLFWALQPLSQLSIENGPTLLGSAGSNQTISGTIASASTFSITAGLLGNSAISVNFKYRLTPNTSLVDSNTVIDFQNGVLRWPYALNGTTIQNSLNDISTRNLFYYGSLNFTSDPRIKENVEDADLSRCMSTVRALPLRRFKYIDSYCSTFQVADTRRLGFLATELQEFFPKSVHASDTVFPALSTSLLTIDTGQVDMAHLGATKYLIDLVSRLEEQVATLESQTRET